MAAVLALVSSALWGTADFAGGLLSKRLKVMAVVGWSQAAALAAFAVAAAVSRPQPQTATWAWWAMLAGATGAGGLVAFYRALAMGTMGVVSPIAALGAVVPLVAGLLAGERPTGLQFAGMAVALAGAVAASGPELSGGAATGPRSVLLAVLSGVLFGVALVGIARGAQGDPVLTMLVMRTTSVTLFVAAALAARTVGGVRARDVPALVAVGLADAGANLLFAIASTFGMVSVVSVLGALYPVATVLLARLVLHERLQRIQLVGVGAALAGVALLSAASH